MRRRAFLQAVGAGCVGLGGWSATDGDDKFAERWSWAMGQPVHVMTFARSERQGLDACAAALAELRRVESHLTLFDDASDLCELNRHAGRGPMRLADDLLAALRQAHAFTRATAGAFSVAIEPLMRVWGFHRARHTAPSPAEIAAAREAVATAVLRVEGDVARLPNAHTQLDLGAIGVGYGIDRALEVLRARGIRRALLDVSGDIGAIGSPPGERGWLVAVADPDHPGRPVATTRLHDAALATSANSVAVVRYGALLAGHVMNPATGWPAYALRQATVVARTAIQADALSTALLVSARSMPGMLWSHTIPMRVQPMVEPEPVR